MKLFQTSKDRQSLGWCSIFIVILILAIGPATGAETLKSARVTQIIKDVKLLGGAGARPAAVSDEVREGAAVRTGVESRAELTFADLTITRLGANTVFSFNEGARQVNLDSGALLLQVPKGGAAVRINTAAATAAVTGGTCLCESNKGFPLKVLTMEGATELCSKEHPDICETAHGGEMVSMTVDGQITKPVKFKVDLVYKTSKLIQGFPSLPNADLIFQVIETQQAEFFSNPFDQGNPIDKQDLRVDASPPPSPPPQSTPGPTPPPSKFGPPTTITSPNPYVINSGTQINTDPTITNNGVTDFGKIYRGPAQDGSEFDYLFGSTSAFDATIGNFFNNNGNGVPVAVFKFSSLQLTGNPTITIPSGATTFLGLVSVGDVTSGPPGGTLTFAGLDRLFIATQNGSINLGSEIGFSNIGHVTFYARGSGSNLTLGSAISGAAVVHLFSEGTVQVNGDITSSSDFRSFSGGDFLAGTGTVIAKDIEVRSLSNINIDGSKFPNPPDSSGSVVLNAANTLNIAISGGGTFGWDTLDAQGMSINLTSATPTTFDISNSSSVTLTAGTGGINAPNIDFVYTNLTLTSGAGINIRSATFAGGDSNGAISAATSFSASGDVDASTLMTGTTVDVGGHLFVNDTLTAGGNINIGGYLVVPDINAPSGVLTVQGGIFPETNTDTGSALQHTFDVDSIVSPAGIDFDGNRFNGFAGLFSGGLLTINANTLTFDSATGIAFANFNGADAGAFGSGNPANGGDGGTFIVNTTGNITANNGADITATTGSNTAGTAGATGATGPTGTYSGAGGSVTLHSTGGMVTVNDTIQVSSDDPTPNQTPPPPVRRSASGGTILLRSDLTTGSGITVGANGQLLSLLNANAPGPGGSITLSTMGADITVTGTIEADRGTITMDQSDPVGPTRLITIDGATLISDTLNIHSAGDLNIGASLLTSLNFTDATLHGDRDVNLNVPNTSLPEGINKIDITGGNAINLTGGNSEVAATLNLNLTSASTFTAGTGGINAPFIDILFAGAELNLVSGSDITAHSITFTDFYARGIVSAAGAISITNDLGTGSVSAGTSIDVGGSMFAAVIDAGTTISAGGDIQASLLTAGGDISANITRVQTITSPTGILTVADKISPDVFSTDPLFPEQGAKAPHVYSVDSIVAPNGIDFSGNQFGGINGYTSGGLLTVNVTTLTFNPATGIGVVNFNGADAGALDFQGGVFTTVGGDGGVFIANASGDITTTSNSPISATTGLIDPNLSSATSSGAGGTVELNSTNGTVSVDSTIQVSSDDPIPNQTPPPPVRRSAQGGNINLSSGKASGVAINVSNSTQLLALLNASAPGPGGTITILATGASSQAKISGTLEADRGTVDIRQTGDDGLITLGDQSIAQAPQDLGDTINIRADIVKVGALGTNGMLTIGAGTISADTILKLYAGGSNGTIDFIDNVTLSSGSAMYLAANKITIEPTFTVTITGDGGPANIFTNNPNYNFTPSAGYTGPTGNPNNGSFGGNGALDPQPLASAPPFGPPPAQHSPHLPGAH